MSAIFIQICYDETMKKLSLYIFLVLMCCNNSFAEDIADFQIEGISIGNSLLEYYSKKKILRDTTYEKEQGNNKEVGFLYLDGDDEKFKNYRRIKLGFKTKSKDYKIILITAFVDINKDINKCIVKKQEITKDLENLFNNLNLEEYGWKQHSFDATSRTNSSVIYFPTNSKYESFIRVICYDWSKKSDYDDQLRIELVSSEYYEWLSSL